MGDQVENSAPRPRSIPAEDRLRGTSRASHPHPFVSRGSDTVLLPIFSPKAIPSGWGRLSWFEPLGSRNTSPQINLGSAGSVSCDPGSGYVTDAAFRDLQRNGSHTSPSRTFAVQGSLETLQSVSKRSFDDIGNPPIKRGSLRSLHRSVLSLRARQASGDSASSVVQISSDEGKPPSGPNCQSVPLQKSNSNVDLRSFVRLRTKRALNKTRSVRGVPHSPPIPPRNSCNSAFEPECPERRPLNPAQPTWNVRGDATDAKSPAEDVSDATQQLQLPVEPPSPSRKWSIKFRDGVTVKTDSTSKSGDHNNGCTSTSTVKSSPLGLPKKKFALFRRSATQGEFSSKSVAGQLHQTTRLVSSSSSSCSSGSICSLNQPPNSCSYPTVDNHNFSIKEHNSKVKAFDDKPKTYGSSSANTIHDELECNDTKRNKSSDSSSQARDDTISSSGSPDQGKKSKGLAFFAGTESVIKNKFKKTLQRSFIKKRDRSLSVSGLTVPNDDSSSDIHSKVSEKKVSETEPQCSSLVNEATSSSPTSFVEFFTDFSDFELKCLNSVPVDATNPREKRSISPHLPPAGYFRADEVLKLYKSRNAPDNAFTSSLKPLDLDAAAECSVVSEDLETHDENSILETLSDSVFVVDSDSPAHNSETLPPFETPESPAISHSSSRSSQRSTLNIRGLPLTSANAPSLESHSLEAICTLNSSTVNETEIQSSACPTSNSNTSEVDKVDESVDNDPLTSVITDVERSRNSSPHSSLNPHINQGPSSAFHHHSNLSDSVDISPSEDPYVRISSTVASSASPAYFAVKDSVPTHPDTKFASEPSGSITPDSITYSVSSRPNCPADESCSSSVSDDLVAVPQPPGGGASDDSMSHPGGTLRRGIKATTSRIIGASIRRPGLSPAVSLDRTLGYGPTEPSRFVDGVSFKGKLIGVLEVEAARGDRMCQEALAELKGAVRAAGEHKQRIAVTVAMDGIRLRDDRTGDCLYHHPVHKISFIAQDMTDSRAFGYIFGSPDAGHKFFGIKTEKTASQVVIAMRDLFQVVFEMKKKEIEKARSQLEEGRDGADFKEEKPFDPFGDSFRPVSLPSSTNSSGGKGGLICGSSTLPSSKNRLPSTSSVGSNVSISNIPPTLAPPPLSGRTRHDSSHSRQHAQQRQQQQHTVGGSDSEHLEFATKFPVDFSNMTRAGAQSVPPHDVSEDRYAVFKEVRPASDESLNDFSKSGNGGTFTNCRMAMSHEAVDARAGFEDEWSLNDLTGSNVTSEAERQHGSNYDVFVDLDPLGTGKSKPFIDKKDFFNDVRKQTKRLLRELGDGEDSHPGSPRTQTGVIPTEVSVLVASSSLYSSSGIPYTSTEALASHLPSSTTSTTPMHMAAIASHSFSESFSPPLDSYEDYRDRQHHSGDLQHQQQQQFETPVSGFADFNRFAGESPRSQRSEMSSSSMPDEPTPQIPVGALTVALPPESFRDSPPSFSPPHSSQQQQEQLQATASPEQSPQQTQKHLIKQTLPCPAETVSPKTLPRSHKFLQQESVEGDWDSPRQKNTPQLDASQTHDGFDSLRGLGGWSDQQSESSLQFQSREGIASVGGTSPRPRPRGSLTKHLSASSATLPLRQPQRYGRKFSHDQNFDLAYEDREYKGDHESYGRKYGSDEQFSSPEGECRPFPNEDLEGAYEEAPFPPPRPAPIEPPPLPPKRQPTDIKLRPPPRPPSSASQDAHYLYINDKYDLPPESSRANTSAGDITTSPPIPLPSRKPRYSADVPPPACMPNRANKPTFIATEPFHFPRPNLSPTHDSLNTGAIPKLASCSRDSTPSKTSTPSGKSPRSGKRPSTGSIDLTNTSLDQLATKLEIPVEQLAKMTVVELAACLAQLQLKQEAAEAGFSDDVRSSARFSVTSQSSSRDRSEERLDTKRDRMAKLSDEEEFARFDAQFPSSPLRTPEFPLSLEATKSQSLGAPVSEDRYAVFRELTVTTKHKSVFDENFLTPQNSMEDEVSEVSSGTFKVNFAPPDYRQDSMDMKSSVSDDLEQERDQPSKHWSTVSGHEEGVTVFRSPDISEYENFEPNFEAKFVDDFSEADKHSLDMIEVTGPLRSPASQKLSTDSGKSPFTDDFSCISQEEIAKTICAPKARTKSSVGKFEDDFVPQIQQDKYAVFRELEFVKTPSKPKSSTSSKSPFDDNFVENGPQEGNVMDSGFLSTAEAEFDKFDDVFKDAEETKDDVMEDDCPDKGNTNPDADSVQMAQEDNDSPNKSPFDEYPSNRNDRYEVLKEIESEREPSLEGDVEESEQRFSRSSPYGGSWHDSSRNTPYNDHKFRYGSPQSKNVGGSLSASGEVASIDDGRSNIMDRNLHERSFEDRPRINQVMSLDERVKFNNNNRDSPYEDCLSGSRDVSLEMNNGFVHSGSTNRPKTSELSRSRSSTTPICYDRRYSPVSPGGEAVQTSSSLPPVDIDRKIRGISRVSSTSNDEKPSPSPFDDNFSSAVESVAEDVCFETAFPSLQPLPDSLTDEASAFPFADCKPDDLFVSENNAFADFENAFHDDHSTSGDKGSDKPTPRTPNPSFDVSQEIFPDGEMEFRVSARFTQSSKDDPDNIFRRNSDPFAEDFFAEDVTQGGSVENATNDDAEGDKSWQEPFEVFNFSSNTNSSTK
ncbi:PTB/PI domain [Trinorchestia longiramus]|nr:PTB/PI domain [Trinorchestia longiramus]